MRLTYVVFALLVSLLFARQPLRASDWAATVKQVEASIVFVAIGEDGGCTAFVINQQKHYLLTAAHCFPDKDESLWADHVEAKVIYLNQHKDLMILEAKDLDPSRPALRLALKNPARGQEVMSVGFGYALERPFFRQARVQDDAMVIPEDGLVGPYISTDAPFVEGQSGGPVVNALGEVVAVVQRSDAGTTGLGLGVEAVRAQVGRFIEAAPAVASRP